MALRKRIAAVVEYAFDHSVFLMIGAVAAMAWANAAPQGYSALIDAPLWVNPYLGALRPDGLRVLTPLFLVNEVMMFFFFAMTGKVIWECTHPGGPFHEPRVAAVPLIATVGGMAAPAAVYLALAAMTGHAAELARGCAVPCATDVAFSYVAARLVFGRGHPAIAFLLTLAVADDFGGLLVIALFYGQADGHVAWLLLSAAAVGLAWAMRRAGVRHAVWYLLLPGALSWIGFYRGGVHPALAFLPVIPILPHTHDYRPAGSVIEAAPGDTLDQLHAILRRPIELALGLFGLMNAGVSLAAAGPATWPVAVGLLIGKPAGIFLFGAGAALALRGGLPGGMRLRDLLTAGCAAGIGFTVALFVARVAFPPGATQDAARMGALMSFAAFLVTLIVGAALRVSRAAGPPGVKPSRLTF
jgi:NhaA family Na+:H+ antiporter